jgi:hypothetical protein
MSTTFQPTTGSSASPRFRIETGAIDGAAAAFGMAAVVAIVFNTVLAWVKDAYDPLNSFMASLTGHHWKTHGLVDIAVFLIIGFVLMARGFRIDGTKLALSLTAAIVVGGGGLALWFVLV